MTERHKSPVLGLELPGATDSCLRKYIYILNTTYVRYKTLYMTLSYYFNSVQSRKSSEAARISSKQDEEGLCPPGRKMIDMKPG